MVPGPPECARMDRALPKPPGGSARGTRRAILLNHKMKAVKSVAAFLNVDEVQARVFCIAVQKLCPGAPPSYDLIASALAALPEPSRNPGLVADYCRTHRPPPRPITPGKQRRKTTPHKPHSETKSRPKVPPHVQRARAISYLRGTLKRQGQLSVDPEAFYEEVLEHTRNILQRPSHVPWAARSLEREDMLATPISVSNRLRDLYARRTPPARGLRR